MSDFDSMVCPCNDTAILLCFLLRHIEPKVTPLSDPLDSPNLTPARTLISLASLLSGGSQTSQPGMCAEFKYDSGGVGMRGSVPYGGTCRHVECHLPGEYDGGVGEEVVGKREISSGSGTICGSAPNRAIFAWLIHVGYCSTSVKPSAPKQ
ncbi:hypothetical protein BDQ17DRAFT_1340066 [Cyathus striatus]|nr:hypothetical protein BDQ17DRAFT_1340066 [Cyathus striatus]